MAPLALKSSVALRAAGAVRPRPAGRRTVAVQAKYGEGSKYFDLQDLENTTGAWDMYGVDEKKRYPDLQSAFFAQSADIISRREALRTFVALAGVASAVAYGIKGAEYASLPITKGPQTGGENGKGGSVRSKL